MSERIEESDGETETEKLLHVAKCRLGRCDSAVIDKSRDTVVSFNGGIYVLYDYKSSNLVWAVDYYTYKLLAENTTRFGITTYHNVFCIQKSEKTLDTRMTNSPELLSSHYKYFMETHVDLTEKSDKEINAIHLEILESEIRKKLLDIPSVEQIKAREEVHRGILQESLYSILSRISETIYEAAKKGKKKICISFNTITENAITRYGKTPRFTKFPCGDGRVRETFEEYFYYLFEGIYERHDGEDEPIWIWDRLFEQLSRIFPHLSVSCGPMDGLMPQIIIEFPVDVSLSKLIH